MSAILESDTAAPLTSDDFSALEQRVVRTIELLKSERESRIAAEQQVAQLREQVEEHTIHVSLLQEEITGLQQERTSVRQRVERLLKNFDEITGI